MRVSSVAIGLAFGMLVSWFAFVSSLGKRTNPASLSPDNVNPFVWPLPPSVSAYEPGEEPQSSPGPPEELIPGTSEHRNLDRAPGQIQDPVPVQYDPEAWKAPGDLSHGCLGRAIVANTDPVGSRCPTEAGQYKDFHAQAREDRAMLHRYFCRKLNGRFVEIGAIDGLKYSNTLHLERALNWSGLLIEGQPQSAAALARNRQGNRANTISAKAVCAKGETNALFTGGARHTSGGLVDHLKLRAQEAYKNREPYEVPCAPFGSMLLDAGFGPDTPVDFASIDVEGAEHLIMETMDFSIPVRVWIVELDDGDPENEKRVRAALQTHGYRESRWSPSEYCKGVDPSGPLRRHLEGRLCPRNVLFEHPSLVIDPDSPVAGNPGLAVCGA